MKHCLFLLSLVLWVNMNYKPPLFLKWSVSFHINGMRRSAKTIDTVYLHDFLSLWCCLVKQDSSTITLYSLQSRVYLYYIVFKILYCLIRRENNNVWTKGYTQFICWPFISKYKGWGQMWCAPVNVQGSDSWMHQRKLPSSVEQKTLQVRCSSTLCICLFVCNQGRLPIVLHYTHSAVI